MYHFTVAPDVIPPAVSVAVEPEQIETVVTIGLVGPVTVTCIVFVPVQPNPLSHKYVIVCVPTPANEGLKQPYPLPT